MESSNGSPESPDELHFVQKYTIQGNWNDVTEAEQELIASDEPYCFRCGKPASSFHIYQVMSADGFGNENAAEYVRTDEGTYNPETNRFACDGCYIEIGMPTSPTGWIAP